MIGGKEGQIEVTTGPELGFNKGKTGHLVVRLLNYFCVMC